MWWILYIAIGILVLIVIPHFVVTFFIFAEFFKHMSPKTIDKRVLKNANYEAVREEMFALAEQGIKECKEVDIFSYDNLKLHGYYFDKGFDKVIIMFHGVHANGLFHFSIQTREFINRGFNVLVIDERAHGKSEGKYITYGQKEQEDVLSWISYVENVLNFQNIYLYGLSMGATSIALASPRFDNKIKGMIIDCGFTNINELIDHIVGSQHIPKQLFYHGLIFLAKHLADINFNDLTTVDRLKQTSTPAFFVQGTKDIVATQKFLMDNYNACSSKKEILEVEGAPHTLSVPLEKEKVLNKIFNFLEI